MVRLACLSFLSFAAAEAAGRSSDSSGCIVVHDDDQDVKIEAYGANALRVRAVVKGDSFYDDLISALVPPADGITASTCAELYAAGGPAEVTNGNLNAKSENGKLVFTRVSDKKVLLTEKTRTFAPATVTPPIPGFYTLDLEFEAVAGERIYGLGQHKTGQLDNKGILHHLNPQNTEILIPIAHSSLGYSFLFNLPSFGTVEYSDDASIWKADAVKQMDFVVTTTSDSPPHAISPWAQLQSAYANVTGHAPVYPEWSSGFWQCRNRYHNQTQIMDVAKGYVERDYPISLIIIDYFNWNDPDDPMHTPLGDEALPATCWPDPKVMVDELKGMGVELMLSPYFHSITSASKHYTTALEKGYIVPGPDGKPAKVAFADAYLYDLFQPEARAFAFQAVEDGYIKPYGLHHWWLDCDEPCGGNMGDLVYNNGTWPAAFVGAAYPHMLDRMVWEGMGAPGKEYARDNVMLG